MVATLMLYVWQSLTAAVLVNAAEESSSAGFQACYKKLYILAMRANVVTVCSTG